MDKNTEKTEKPNKKIRRGGKNRKKKVFPPRDLQIATQASDTEKTENVLTVSGSKRTHDNISEESVDHFNDDSENEETSKKKPKKKKKKPVVESSGSKNSKSIRQAKREKHAQRKAEEDLITKTTLKQEALNYLTLWKNTRSEWKFAKAKQVWIYKNKFSKELIPDKIWPVFLEYFSSANGNIKKMIIDDANKVIEKMEKWTEKNDKEKEQEDKEDEAENSGDEEKELEEQTEETAEEKPDKTSYKRARDIIQHIEE